MWKKLLVPHDFSACADRALRLAARLAAAHGASLTVLHVSDLPANLSPDALISVPGEGQAVRIDEYTTRGARQRLEALAEPLRKEGFPVEVVATTGDVAAEILSVADVRAVDAIVVGTHGRQGLAHLLLGSVAEKLVRYSPIPVVTVRSKAPEAELTREEATAEDELAG